MNKLWLIFKILITYKNGYTFFLEKLNLVKRKFTIYHLYNGLKYKTRVGTTDFAILNENTIFNEYYDKYYNSLTHNSLVVDFGAQLGSFTCFTAHTKKCHIICFEPDKSNFCILKENIVLNDLDQLITPINKAIANKKGQVKFFPSQHSNKGVHSMNYIGDNPVQVEAITPLDLIESFKIERIDFLKIDVEGAEHQILDTRFQSFFKIVSHMVLEYHCQDHVSNKQPLEELLDKIARLGFQPRAVGTNDIGIIYCSK